MSTPFVFINTCAIRPGKAETYRQLCDQVTDLVDAEEPGMLYFASCISDDGASVSTMQIHADVTNLSRHMELVGPLMGQAMQECLDTAQMRIDIYGSASEILLAELRTAAGTGIAINVHEPERYVNRLSSP